MKHSDTNILESFKHIISSVDTNKQIINKFIERIAEGNFTRDENNISHFCIYFGAYDPKIKSVFIGRHRKSGLWLFNGGHVDKNETVEESLQRESMEEWGIAIEKKFQEKASFLSITNISRPTQACKTHFDIWYFIRVTGNSFMPDDKKVQEEFYEARWVTINQARKLVTDKNTLLALNLIENYVSGV